MALRASISVGPRWFEPPTQNIRPLTHYIRCRGDLPSEETLVQELDHLSTNTAQRVDQVYMLSAPADVGVDPNEIDEVYGPFYAVSARTLLMTRPQAVHQVLNGLDGLRTRSNREAGPLQTTAGRLLSGTVVHHPMAATAAPVNTAPLVPPVAPPVVEAEAAPEDEPGHPSGLPAMTLLLRIASNNVGNLMVTVDYRRTGGKEPSQLVLAEVAAMRLQWLPTWEDLETAYNLQPSWVATHLDYDRAAADLCARFLVACFFGPLHVATSTGEATPGNRRLIRNLTMALRDATKSPGRVTQRGVSMMYASGRAGRLWTLKFGITHPQRMLQIVQHINEDRMRTDAAVLFQMLTDPYWADRSENVIWRVWLETVHFATLLED